jgi:L-ribulose-5-phosphate 3-epimerase
MQKGINYWAFPPEQGGCGTDIPAAIRLAKDIGFDCIELTVERSGPLSLESEKDDIYLFRREADKAGIELKTLATGLAWEIPQTHPDPSVREESIAAYKKVIRIAGWLGVETLLYIPGLVSAVFVPDFEPQRYDLVYERAKDALLELIPEAEKQGVVLGVENVWNRFLLSPLEMKTFIDSFGSSAVGSYFDVGNVMLTGHPEHWILILGERIKAVHVKDFRVSVGSLDGFVDLLAGDVDYTHVIEHLAAVGYNGPVTAEYVPPSAGAAEKAYAAMRIIEG